MKTKASRSDGPPRWASTDRIPPAAIRAIAEAACRAPSVHNTQPWRWTSAQTTLSLWADRTRQLVATDPSGRDLTISCGAALDHAHSAASALGFASIIDRLPDPDRPDLLAQISLRPSAVPENAELTLDSIQERCTDRRRFTSWPIPPARIQRLIDGGAYPGVTTTAVGEVTDRIRIDLLVSRAIDDQARHPQIAQELLTWLGVDRKDDVAWTSVIDGTDSLLVLSTPDDARLSWLNVGESLSAISLAATRDGLSVIPLTRVVEVAATRAFLRSEVLKSTEHPQMLLRVGWQAIGRSTLPRTPRRPLSEVFQAG